ncbi:hypothetical protein C8Q79DRAFT_957612 [Trametes meyenii]|nr:hypothetical protein C8Q79DRAFT_957612 [Trametes meyenii]
MLVWSWASCLRSHLAAHHLALTHILNITLSCFVFMLNLRRHLLELLGVGQNADALILVHADAFYLSSLRGLEAGTQARRHCTKVSLSRTVELNASTLAKSLETGLGAVCTASEYTVFVPV